MRVGTVFANPPSRERLFIDYWSYILGRIFHDKGLFDFLCQTLFPSKQHGWKDDNNGGGPMNLFRDEIFSADEKYFYGNSVFTVTWRQVILFELEF